MRAPADLDLGNEATRKETAVTHKSVDPDTSTSVPGPSSNPCPAADGFLGRHSTAFIVGLVAVCFLATTGTVMYVNGVEDTVTAAAGTWQGLKVRVQEHLSEEVEQRNARRQLLQTGVFIADAPNASAAAVPVDTCNAIAGQAPTWGNPAMQMQGTCTTYHSTMGGSSYSKTARLDWTVCWGVNVTAVRTSRGGRQAVRFVGRMSPWSQGGWYPVDVLQYGTRRSNDTSRPVLIDCPVNVVSRLSPVCGCEHSLAVGADGPSDSTPSNNTDCQSPDLLVTDPAFCVF